MTKPKKITTIKDIAKEVGISATAVSRALNGKGGISKETEQKVKETAKKLQYTPNIVAKSLRLNKTKTIGIVVSDSSHSFFAKVIKGIEETAAVQGYSIILCNTNQDYEKEKKAIKLLINKRIDGIILAASLLTSPKDIEFLKSFNVPFVFLIRRNESEDVDYVINDNKLGSYLMTDYLLKQRKERIHFFELPQYIPSWQERLVGYKQALEENGLEYDTELIYNIKPYVEDGYIMMRQLLDKGENINTIFCACDVLAIGVMEAILERGLKIPEDIRVAGYDDIDFSAYLRVPLTTVRQPKYSIGCKGTELLINKIEYPTKNVQHLILKPELIIRKST